MVVHRLPADTTKILALRTDSLQVWLWKSVATLVRTLDLATTSSPPHPTVITCRATEMSKAFTQMDSTYTSRHFPPWPPSLPVFASSVCYSFAFCLRRNKRIRAIRLWRRLPRGSVSTTSNLAPHMSSSSGPSPRQPPPRPCPPPLSPLPRLLLLSPPHPPHPLSPLPPPCLHLLSTTAPTAPPWSCRHSANVSARFTPPVAKDWNECLFGNVTTSSESRCWDDKRVQPSHCSKSYCYIPFQYYFLKNTFITKIKDIRLKERIQKVDSRL